MSARRLLPLLGALASLALGGSPAHAAYPGMNGNLLFSRCGANICDTAHLYSVGPDGSDPFQFTSGPTYDDDASYSADGSRVVFQRCDASCGIAIENADGSAVQQLTPNDGSTTNVDDYPALSPDGSKIIFSRVGTDPAALWVMGADGSDPHKLLDTADSTYQASFSPDGSKIAFVDTSGALALVNSDGSGTPHEIDTPPSGADSYPDWSPDGSRIVFQRGPSSADQRLWVVPADGSAPAVELMDPGAGTSDSEPAFSPDGAKLAFERYPTTGRGSQIWVANSDGSDAARVTCEDCTDYHADWRPLHPAAPPPAAPAAPPAFGGIKLRLGTITVPASGIVRILESCPASVHGSCAGTLTLKTAGPVAANKKHRRVLTLGHGTFTIAAGTSAKTKVKLSSTAMKLLQARSSLKAVVTVVSHDGTGVAKTTSTRITLKPAKHRKKHHR